MGTPTKKCQRSRGTSRALRSNDDEDWIDWDDPKRRRQMQNRLNQRAARRRRATALQEQRSLAERNKIQPRSLRPKECQAAAGIDEDTELQLSWLFFRRVPSYLGGFGGMDHPALKDPRVRRVFHYGCTVAWPGLESMALPAGESLASALYRASIQVAGVMEAQIGMLATERLLRSQSVDDTHVLLESHAKSAGGIRMDLADNAATDTTLLAIMGLSLQKNPTLAATDPSELSTGSFDSPIRSLGWLDTLSRSNWAAEHLDVLRRLARARGSAGAITVAGVAEQMQFLDIVRASVALERPYLPLCATYQSMAAHEVASAHLLLPRIEGLDLDPDVKRTLLDLRLCCRLVEQYCEQPSDGRQAGLLAQYRSLVQYRLLSLPNSGIGADEVCRLAGTIFSYGVTFPMADPRPLRALASKLCLALKQPWTIEDRGYRLLLWATVVGALAAANTDLEESFAMHLKQLSQCMQIYHWAAVKMLMRAFIWLDRACDEGAQSIWMKSLGVRRTRVFISGDMPSRFQPPRIAVCLPALGEAGG